MIKFTRRQINTAIDNAIKGTHNADALITKALHIAVLLSLGDGNGDDGIKLYDGVTDRYKGDIKAYLLQYGFFTVHGVTGALRQKKGIKATDEDKAKAAEVYKSLPAFSDFKKAAKTKNPVEKKPVPDIMKTVNSTLSRGKKSLVSADLTDPKAEKAQASIAALESYKSNIDAGIPLEQAIGHAKTTEKAIQEKAVKNFIAEVLEGETKAAKDFIKQLAAIQSKPAKVSPKTVSKKKATKGA